MAWYANDRPFDLPSRHLPRRSAIENRSPPLHPSSTSVGRNGREGILCGAGPFQLRRGSSIYRLHEDQGAVSQGKGGEGVFVFLGVHECPNFLGAWIMFFRLFISRPKCVYVRLDIFIPFCYVFSSVTPTSPRVSAPEGSIPPSFFFFFLIFLLLCRRRQTGALFARRQYSNVSLDPPCVGFDVLRRSALFWA